MKEITEALSLAAAKSWEYEQKRGKESESIQIAQKKLLGQEKQEGHCLNLAEQGLQLEEEAKRRTWGGESCHKRGKRIRIRKERGVV